MEKTEGPDHLGYFCLSVLVSRTEVDYNPLADLSLLGPVGLHQMEGLILLVSSFLGSDSEVHSDTIPYTSNLSI